MIDDRDFPAIWDRFADSLLGFIRARVASREDAEDLLQEVFSRVHTGLCCMPEWEGLERWLYRVARNLIVDHYRSRRPSEEYEDSATSTLGLPGEDEDPAARLALSLRDMVEKLPGPDREVLVLSEYEGLSQADLAGRLGISLPAAKSRLLRARAKLKEVLLECCHFELDRLGGIIDYEERCASCDLERHAKGLSNKGNEPQRHRDTEEWAK